MHELERQAARRALGLPIEPITAGLGGSGRFKEWLHPRDRKGEFIEKFSRIKLFRKGRGEKPEVGKVERLNRDGSVSVKLSDGPSAGSIVNALPSMIEESQAKAVLNEPAPAPPAPQVAKRPWAPFAPRRPQFTGSAAGLVKDAKTYDDIARALEGKPLVTFDYETTGLYPNRPGHEDRGVEVAAVRTVNGVVVDRFHSLMNPGEGRTIHPKASEVTGIYDADVADAPSHADVAKQLKDFIGNDIVVAHNAQFDLDMLDASLKDAGVDWKPLGVIDTLSIARDTMTSDNKKTGATGVVKDHKLGTLTEFFDIELGKAHRADADAEATSHLLQSVLAYAAKDGATPSDLDAITAKWHDELKDFPAKMDAFYPQLDAWEESEAGN